jgi:hypothetical protein
MIKGSHHSEASRQVLSRPRPKRDPLERFVEKIDYNGPTIRPELGPCHLWTGKRQYGKFPYGQFYYRGRWVAAHRFIYEHTRAPLADRNVCSINVNGIRRRK